MMSHPVRCLILACGNTLRGDDGVGPWLADWAQDRFAGDPSVSVFSAQQWTPDLAHDIAQAQSVVFIDCSIESSPGRVAIRPVDPTSAAPGLATHHVGAAELLGLALELYGSIPRSALLLTIGAGSTELGEGFSDVMAAALPRACDLLESTICDLLVA
jgi:hydrogenase maturation protease